jgi:hypothetical protein
MKTQLSKNQKRLDTGETFLYPVPYESTLIWWATYYYLCSLVAENTAASYGYLERYRIKLNQLDYFYPESFV